MSEKNHELSPDKLRLKIDPDKFAFRHTGTLEPPEKKVLGQERAADAIKFGIGMKKDNYHIFIAGPQNAGLTYIARTYLEERAKKEPTPPDWCYVYNFKNPDEPMCLKMSPCKGKSLKKDMAELIGTLETSVPATFDSDDYSTKDAEIRRAFEQERDKIIEELSLLAKKENFILQVSQVGMIIIPANEAGQPITQEDLSKLSDEEKERLKEKSIELHAKMKESVKKIREAERRFKEKRAELKKNVAMFIVPQHMEIYFEKYKEETEVINYLNMVQEDIVENIDEFIKPPEPQQTPPFPVIQKESLRKKYEINVLVDNSETNGAPVVIESNPIYPTLFGAIERQALFGALFTDFTMIKPGVLHKANGGYLVIKALDLLKWYLSWEALKRALRNKEIRIEDLGELYGIITTKTIRPEPIPLDIKIVLTGDPYLFELLYLYDDRFKKLFKVKAHMDDSMDMQEETFMQFARMIGNFCTEQKLRHLTNTGVARIVEYSITCTEDWKKLSLELGDIKDLLLESDYYAGLDDDEYIKDKHVEKAISKRIFRANLVEERVKELIKRDIFWIETEGKKIGQINGLSILMTGDHEFGKPSRITATVSVGREGIITIDRESKMSGKIHTKGVMILSSFLKERFAHNKPLSLTATICFEQSYGLIDGDSASSAELFVLLSAIGNIPIYQGIAVTGSVSQKGEIQPVGGVTKKIEGFFDICKHKGLDGKQGVIIPSRNIENLMLRQEIVESVKKGEFHIWSISRIEDGIEILTGMKAGTMTKDGTYPEDTVFGKVDSRLTELAQIVKRFGKQEEERAEHKDQ